MASGSGGGRRLNPAPNMSSTPYRIAIITDALGDPPRNGRELPIYELARALSRQHRVDLLGRA